MQLSFGYGRHLIHDYSIRNVLCRIYNWEPCFFGKFRRAPKEHSSLRPHRLLLMTAATIPAGRTQAESTARRSAAERLTEATTVSLGGSASNAKAFQVWAHLYHRPPSVSRNHCGSSNLTSATPARRQKRSPYSMAYTRSGADMHMVGRQTEMRDRQT